MGEVFKIVTFVILLSRLCWTQVDGSNPNNSTVQVSSTYRIACKDECVFHDEDSYFWCNTDNGWDYCSPRPDVTYMNETCNSGHSCGTWGYEYTWCWTDSSWGYCSLLQTHDHSNIVVRHKRQANIVQICSVNDEAKKRRTTITAEPTNDVINDNKLKQEMIDLIKIWTNDKIPNEPKSNLIKSKNLRIDLQGKLKRFNRNYCNLQIQVNVKRENGESTTLAQVIMPQDEDVPDRYVRRAFTESFQRRARVFIDVSDGNIPLRQGQNCD